MRYAVQARAFGAAVARTELFADYIKEKMMKAISIWQPHASLLILGLKPFETRSWTAWKSLIGQRIWIHAGKAIDDLQELNDYLVDRDAGEDRNETFDAYLRALKSGGFTYLRELPRGAILGSAVLAECIPTEQLINPGPFGNFTPGRLAWRMADPIPLAQPIPFVGKQGFFEVPDEVLNSAEFAFAAKRSAQAADSAPTAATDNRRCSCERLPVDVLADYPPKTACIRYRDGSGKVKDWFVGAMPGEDDENSLREHLHRSLPAADFIGWAIH